jgi:hypothetical protein
VRLLVLAAGLLVLTGSAVAILLGLHGGRPTLARPGATADASHDTAPPPPAANAANADVGAGTRAATARTGRAP